MAALLGATIWLTTKPQLGVVKNLPYVWGNALQVANPEYRIYHRGNDYTTRGLLEAVTALEIDTHVNAAASEKPSAVVEVTQSILGDVTFPALPASPLHPYIADFNGGAGDDAAGKRAVEERARSLPAHQQVIVLAELAKPLSEEELSRSVVAYSNSEMKRFFLSGIQGSGKPLYWWPGWNGCSALSKWDNNCGARSVVADFRKWVHQFTENDSINLAKVGLDLHAMKRAAAVGRVYGFMDTRTGSREVLELLVRPEIRTVKIVALVPELNN
ncbi:hypothetical protein ACFWY5_56860 [Nonomuraea sp. NPDC059007]|uniref:hypothetical protein n=1 Tax=Nonomuraea sp. NPDC059007 TaxID=3346692 RepID=UPI0036C2CE70